MRRADDGPLRDHYDALIERLTDLSVTPMMASVLIPLKYSAPLAILSLGVLATYWYALRPGQAPRSRRRIRRANTMVQVALVLALVYGLSVASHDVAPGRFLLAWIGVILLLGLTILFALMDSWNNVRIHRRDRREERRRAAERLRDHALQRRRE